MDRLRDIRAERLLVACTSCRRTGSYRIAGLLQRFGGDIRQRDLLAALTASCRYQRGPEAAAPRKYEVQCQARLILPDAALEEAALPAGRPFMIEVWKPGASGVQCHIATIWNLDLARAAFATATEIWPEEPLTLRQGIRIIRKHRMPD
ncbi:hypothetical protein [Methylobacterium oxalidis]|uniref:hypothetical protein n=1 Tax=Methylobacterium oxalidis TaxID=944322 RepID=UPI003315B971